MEPAQSHIFLSEPEELDKPYYTNDSIYAGQTGDPGKLKVFGALITICILIECSDLEELKWQWGEEVDEKPRFDVVQGNLVMPHLEMTMFLKRCEVSQHDIRNETSIDKGFKYQSYITNFVVESNS